MVGRKIYSCLSLVFLNFYLLQCFFFFFFPIVGASKVKKYRKLILDQAKTTSLELVPEEPSEPVPPLIVDHERLKVSFATPSQC